MTQVVRAPSVAIVNSRKSHSALLAGASLSISALLLVGGVIVAPSGTASAATAADVAAVSALDVDPGLDRFPADPLLGERTPFASEELLLTDAQTGLDFRRISNPTFTELEADQRGDAPLPGRIRPRFIPTAATAAGRVTAPFQERTLRLSALDGANSGAPGLLSLTSTSDAAEATTGYTTLAAGIAQPSAGKTYVIETAGRDREGSTVIANDGMSDVPFDRAPMTALPSTVVPAALQWTVMPIGDEDPATGGLFSLASRADGLCLGGSPDGSGLLTPQVCDDSLARQQWRAAPRPGAPDGTTQIVYTGGPYPLAISNSDLGISPDPVVNPGESLPADRDLFTFREVQQPTPIPASVAFAVDKTTKLAFDLTVADLDLVTDERGLPRDEAVTVNTDNGVAKLRVLDWNASSSPRVTTLEGPQLYNGDNSPLTVDTADIDGDQISEIIVTYVDQASQVTVWVARYSAREDGERILEPVATARLGFYGSSGQHSADATVFDLDGDGVQELAYVGVDPNNGATPTMRTVALELSGNALNHQVRGTTVLGSGALATTTEGWAQHVRVESIPLQPATATSGARQVVATWQETGSDAGAYLDAFAIDIDGSAASAFGGRIMTPVTLGSEGVSLAVGGFADGGGGDTSLWGVAVSALGKSSTAGGGSVMLIQPTTPGQAPTVTTQTVAPTSDASMARIGYELTSYDRQGRSVLLGAPVTMTIEQLQNLTLLAGQPPAHSDWLAGDFLNISRTSAFNLEVGSTSAQAYNSTSMRGLTGALKLFAGVRARDTVSEGIPVLADAKETGGVDFKLQGSVDGARNRLTANNVTVESSVTSKTGDDDIVRGLIESYQVTRYPVYSVDSWGLSAGDGCAETCNGYYDVVAPGASPVQLTGGGKGLDGFSPAWQNGNALSYPSLTGQGQVQITDTGTYTVTGPDGAPVETSSPLANVQFGVGGTEQVETLRVASSGQTQTSESVSFGFGFDLDFAGGVSAKVGIPGDRDQANTQFVFGTSFLGTLDGSSSGTATNTHAGQFALSTPTVEENQGYNYGAAVYYDQTGTSKITYGVDLTGNAQSRGFWTRTYGEKPDLALNLPFATLVAYDKVTEQVYGTVEWNPQPERQQIRGFEVRQPDQADGTPGDPLSLNPAAGDQVVFDVPISNYSLKAYDPGADGAATAQFYAVPATLEAARAGDPVPIGAPVPVPALDPQSQTVISSPPWTAVGGEAGAGQDWRIFVVLDEDDTVDEIHEWTGKGLPACPSSSIQGRVTELVDPLTGQAETLACGQNNQGFGRVTVNANSSPLASNAVATTKADVPAPAAKARLVGGGIGTLGTLEAIRLDETTPAPTVVTGRARTLFLRADSAETSSQPRTVVIYDGSPDEGEVVATTTMRGVGPGGNSFASFSYTPQRDGVHELSAVMLGVGPDEPDTGLTVRLNAVSNASGGDGGAPEQPEEGTPAAPDAGTPLGQESPTSAESAQPLARTGLDPWFIGLAVVAGALLVAAGALIRRNKSRDRSD